MRTGGAYAYDFFVIMYLTFLLSRTCLSLSPYLMQRERSWQTKQNHSSIWGALTQFSLSHMAHDDYSSSNKIAAMTIVKQFSSFHYFSFAKTPNRPPLGIAHFAAAIVSRGWRDRAAEREEEIGNHFRTLLIRERREKKIREIFSFAATNIYTLT